MKMFIAGNKGKYKVSLSEKSEYCSIFPDYFPTIQRKIVIFGTFTFWKNTCFMHKDLLRTKKDVINHLDDLAWFMKWYKDAVLLFEKERE